MYIMYHGTSVDSAKNIMKNGFRPSKDGMLGPGIYLSRNASKAGCFPMHISDDQRVVLKVEVDVGKVKRITHLGGLQKTWHDHGYDTAWIPQSCDLTKREENCVWDPKRIRVIAVEKAPSGHLDELKRLLGSEDQEDNSFCTII